MSKERNIILSFQGLRALAFLGIFLYHCGNSDLSQLAAWSVSFFFMISGYLSGYTWKENQSPSCSIRSSVNYTVRRIRKLYLLHILMLILSIPISGALTSLQTDGMGKLPFWIIIFIMSVTLTKSFYPKYYFGFNGVSWFLSSYMVLCLLTPWLLRFTAKLLSVPDQSHPHNSSPRKKELLFRSISILLIIVVLNFGYCFFAGKSQITIQYWIQIFPLARLAEYIVGIIGGMCYNQLPKKFLLPMQWLSCLMILILSLAVDLPEWIYFTVIWMIPNAMLLWGFHGSNSLLTKISKSKLLACMGNHSSYMFLIHQVLISYYFQYFRAPDTLLGKCIITVLLYLLTFGASAGYRLFYTKFIQNRKGKR